MPDAVVPHQRQDHVRRRGRRGLQARFHLVVRPVTSAVPRRCARSAEIPVPAGCSSGQCETVNVFRQASAWRAAGDVLSGRRSRCNRDATGRIFASRRHEGDQSWGAVGAPLCDEPGGGRRVMGPTISVPSRRARTFDRARKTDIERHDQPSGTNRSRSAQAQVRLGSRRRFQAQASLELAGPRSIAGCATECRSSPVGFSVPAHAHGDIHTQAGSGPLKLAHRQASQRCQAGEAGSTSP